MAFPMIVNNVIV